MTFPPLLVMTEDSNQRRFELQELAGRVRKIDNFCYHILSFILVYLIASAMVGIYIERKIFFRGLR
jgi:hypothetical protein